MRPLVELRDVAVAAADAGAQVVRAWWRRGDVVVERKGRGDWVTAADRAAEAAICNVLRAATPEIDVLAEESTTAKAVPEHPVWAVDPLDGTTNFLRGFPVVGVSVGLLVEGRPLVAAVSAPLLGDAWSAAAGLGAHDAAGRRLEVRSGGGRGVVATGFPFRRPENRPRYLAAFTAALKEMEDLRRAGAASLDLAYSAAGVFDGFFELGLSPWDVAAGGLLVLEAGGVVTDWEGDAAAVYRTGNVLAGAPGWHERMLALVRAASPPGGEG